MGCMKRAILAGSVLLLVAACGAAAGGNGPSGPAGQPGRAHAAAPNGALGVPAQGGVAAPTQAPKSSQPANTGQLQPLPSAQPGSGNGPAVGTGMPQCPGGDNPPVHRLC